MFNIVLHEDEFYRYVFTDGPCGDRYVIWIELLNDSEEDRDKIEVLQKAPISDLGFFSQELKKRGIQDEKILNNLKIGLSGLFYKCHNLRDISVLRNFDFTNVDFYDRMFEFCTTLNRFRCGFDIINHPVVREQLRKREVICGGMFGGAYDYYLPDWVDDDLYSVLMYD